MKVKADDSRAVPLNRKTAAPAFGDRSASGSLSLAHAVSIHSGGLKPSKNALPSS